MRTVPYYWADETSGVLRPAVEAYLEGESMTEEQIAAMRAYLLQWMRGGDWNGPEIDALIEEAEGITTRFQITAWLDRALDEAIDPL